MASSSSCAASFQWLQKYDVFISFAGQDTRLNFTSHLHDALCRSTVETYIDYRIDKGDDLWSALEDAIENSALFLIIFSEHYASSTWCLKELEKILECTKDQKHHRVIPVFHKIEPAHVRKQIGSYDTAFSKHENSNHKQHVPNWRKALTTAATLKGWDCETNTNEVDLIKEIVKCVLAKLDCMYQSVSLDGLVGIDKQIADIEPLLCNDSQDIVRFIGIWGMGGIGKTAIATKLYRRFCSTFQSFCFLSNVREESKIYGITHLKNKLISLLLGHSELRMGMPNGATDYDMRRLGRKKVLIVLDDINDPEQLNILVGAHNWFGNGSRVIITTRDKKVLRKYVDDKSIYEVKALEFDEALELFKLKAFENNFFDKEFEELSREVVNYCKGLPLALIVLGSMLYGEDKEEWEGQLKKLKRIPCTEVQQTLTLSYEGLDREEKNILLDIACHLKGRSVEEVKNLLDAHGYSCGLRSLQNKALVIISNSVVSMHDLIQEMGREIVRQESVEDPGKRSRLWDPEDICQVLKYNNGSKAIKSIRLDMSKTEELNLSPQVFAKMHKLTFLEFYNSDYSKRHCLHLPQGLEYLSNVLRYFRWDFYPLKSLPLPFSAENLVKLDMRHSRVTKLWHGVQNVINLRQINLSSSTHLRKLPDFSKALNLKEVWLFNCPRLREVHSSIFSSNKLESLELSNCHALTSLKTDIHLKSLHDLCLYECSNLKEFSVTSENMSWLNLHGTAISELPSSLGHQFKLYFLRLGDCKNLKNIPINLFDNLPSLHKLELSGCCNIFEVVEHLSMVSSASELSVIGSSAESLPTSIKHFSSLKCFTLEKCDRLGSIPELPPYLVCLTAIDCSSLEKVQFSSTAAEVLEVETIYSATFVNCTKLNEHLVSAIQVNFPDLLHKLSSEYDLSSELYDYVYEDVLAKVIYPGSRVPEWFTCRSRHASITIDLSYASLSMDWSLIFCVAIAPVSPRSDEFISIGCKGHMQIINDGKVYEGDGCSSDDDEEYVNLVNAVVESNLDLEPGMKYLTSDHVFLWWDSQFFTQIYERIEKSRATSDPKISLELNFHCYLQDKEEKRQYIELKECGVYPLDDEEYHNFITTASVMGVGCSYQNSDEEEAQPPKKKSKQ